MKPWHTVFFATMALLCGLIYGVLFGYLQWGGCA